MSENKEELKKGEIPWYKDLTTWTAIAAIAASVAAIATVIISIYMWSATKRSADIAQQSTDITRKIYETTNRPFLSIDSVVFTKNEEQKTINIDVYIKNVGNTLAKNCFLQLALLQDEKVVPHQPKEPQNAIVLFPTQTTVLRAAIYSGIYDEVVSRRTKIGLNIDLTYLDVSGQQRYHKTSGYYDAEWNSFLQTSVDAN